MATDRQDGTIVPALQVQAERPPDIGVVYASSLRHAQLKAEKDWVFLYENWERPSLADVTRGVWSRNAAPKKYR